MLSVKGEPYKNYYGQTGSNSKEISWSEKVNMGII